VNRFLHVIGKLIIGKRLKYCCRIVELRTKIVKSEINQALEGKLLDADPLDDYINDSKVFYFHDFLMCPFKPKWERRKDARPQELLSAALDLFVERRLCRDAFG